MLGALRQKIVIKCGAVIGFCLNSVFGEVVFRIVIIFVLVWRHFNHITIKCKSTNDRQVSDD